MNKIKGHFSDHFYFILVTIFMCNILEINSYWSTKDLDVQFT